MLLKLKQLLGQALGYVSEWLESNKLSFCLDKTESILFTAKSKLKSVNKMSITCDGN